MKATGKRCKGTNRRGEPCGCYALTGSAYCFAHDPKRRDEFRAASSKGGAARHGRKIGAVAERPAVEKVDIASEIVAAVKLENARDVLQLLEVAAADALAMERSLARARTLAYIADKAAVALGWIELEDRIARLEQQRL
jgi:hypothetical protein